MNKVLGLIMAFDTDNDLRELTDHRTVGSVPFGGRYRVVDFMLSNMVNAGIFSVGILMRDRYQSLIDHLGNGKDWDLSRKNSGITLLPPYSYSDRDSLQTGGQYRGKIDALSGAIEFLQKNRADYVVLADGDLVANIPLDEVIASHKASGRDLTIVTAPCTESHDFMTYCQVNEDSQITDIRFGGKNVGNCAHTSLGVYIMSRAYLIHWISDCVAHNRIHFEREMLADALAEGKVGSYLFSDYSCKILDVQDFFEANMAILEPEVRNQVFRHNRPVFTRIHDEPPTYYGVSSQVEDCLIADGGHIEGKVTNSVIFRDVVIEKDAEISNSIVMQGGRVLSGASLRHSICDRSVMIREGRTMMGDKSYPIVIAAYSVV